MARCQSRPSADGGRNAGSVLRRAESLPQRYFFLARLKERFPGLSVIIHDDACHLRRFADRREHDSEFAASLAFPNITYIVDRFHGRVLFMMALRLQRVSVCQILISKCESTGMKGRTFKVNFNSN